MPIFDFQSRENYLNLSNFFFSEEYQFRGIFFVVDIFETSICKVPIFCQLMQWPKLYLGLDVRPEIPILKGLYHTRRSKIEGVT